MKSFASYNHIRPVFAANLKELKQKGHRLIGWKAIQDQHYYVVSLKHISQDVYSSYLYAYDLTKGTLPIITLILEEKSAKQLDIKEFYTRLHYLNPDLSALMIESLLIFAKKNRVGQITYVVPTHQAPDYDTAKILFFKNHGFQILQCPEQNAIEVTYKVE